MSFVDIGSQALSFFGVLMLIGIDENRWINTDKIVLIMIATHVIQVRLDSNVTVDIHGDNRQKFLRLMNDAAVGGKPFPEVS
jgi:hypothetical protein